MVSGRATDKAPVESQYICVSSVPLRVEIAGFPIERDNHPSNEQALDDAIRHGRAEFSVALTGEHALKFGEQFWVAKEPVRRGGSALLYPNVRIVVVCSSKPSPRRVYLYRFGALSLGGDLYQDDQAAWRLGTILKDRMHSILVQD